MQSSTVVVLLGICSQLLLPHECRRICSQDEYTVLKVNGSFDRCLPCDTCHPGLGLIPVCGSVISPTQKIECKPCPPGKFSDTYDSASCQNCHECVTHEVVAVNCTKLSDRECSETCQKGYYFVKKAPHIYSCQQCAYCCFDGKDVIQEECVTQGLNATNQHCSQRRDKKCAPKPMSMTNPVSNEPTTTVPPTNHKSNILTIVFGSLAAMSLALAGTILFRWRKGKRNTNTPTPSPEIHQVNTRPQDQDRLPALQNEGIASSTERKPGHNDDKLEDDGSQHGKRNTEGPENHQVNTRPQDQDRLPALQNEGIASSTERTPGRNDDKHEDDVNQHGKRSTEAPNDDASEKLEDPTVVYSFGRKGSIQGESAQGTEGGQSRRRSSSSITMPQLMRKLSFGGNKANYQPVQNEDPDDFKGTEGGQSRRRSSSSITMPQLMRKLSFGGNKANYQPVQNEEPGDLEGPENKVTVSEASLPQDQAVSSTSRLQLWLQNEGFVSSAQGTPCATDDEGDNLPDNSQRGKLPGKRQRSSEDSLTIMEQPTDQKGKEGSKVVFRCEARGKNKITYQWFKDKLKLPGQTNSSLVFDSVRPRDFGCYCCEVRCSDGQNKSEPVKLLSRAAELDVLPREGMRFKYLTEVFRDNLQILESVAKRLQTKVPDAGGWKQVAHKYEMAEETRDSLEGCQERGKSVIDYLKSFRPELTVYEFCKYLKDIKRNDIIIALSDHLVSVAN